MSEEAQSRDIRAIERLLYDYSWHLDMNDPDALAALFTEDCEASFAAGFSVNGRAMLRERLGGIGTYFRATSHHNSNIAIDFIDADSAAVRSSVFAVHEYVEDRPLGLLHGQYIDLVVRHGDGWKFHRRELRTAIAQHFHIAAGNPTGRNP